MAAIARHKVTNIGADDQRSEVYMCSLLCYRMLICIV